MKTSIMLLAFIWTANIYAQVGIGTTTPNASSVLDVNSSSQGFLPPRMTLAQRNAITTPAEGLMIWCSDCGSSGLQVYTPNGWLTFLPILGIGDSYGGGKVAYILQSGDPGYIAGQIHGFIVAPSDQSINADWGCYGTDIPGAAGTALGTGQQNTIDIVNGCATAGIAARICDELVLGGYSDWFLPSKDELNKVYLNRVAIGGLSTSNYWSSSESGTVVAWGETFSNGNQGSFTKTSALYVRAVRAF